MFKLKTPGTYVINLFAIITIPLAIILGIYGVVDWWVIVLIFLSHAEVDLAISRKKKINMKVVEEMLDKIKNPDS